MAEDFQPFPTAIRQAVEERQRAAPQQPPHIPSRPVPRAQNMQADVATAPAFVPPPEISLPVQSPGFSAPSSEPEGVALELPSNYAFYGFKDVYVKPFKGFHLGKLSRAKEEGSTLHMVEVVSSVLSNTAGDQHLGFKLTLPDFYFVLYWLRLNSFTKSVFIHETTCSNQAHIERVTAGDLEASTLKISEIINKSTLITKMLEEIPNPAAYPLESSEIYLYPATMQDAIEVTDDPDLANEEFRYAAALASFIRCHDQSKNSIRDRIKMVHEMSPDDILTIKQYEKAISNYGIEEKVKVTCRGCGASRMDKIQLDASCFLPNA